MRRYIPDRPVIPVADWSIWVVRQQGKYDLSVRSVRPVQLRGNISSITRELLGNVPPFVKLGLDMVNSILSSAGTDAFTKEGERRAQTESIAAKIKTTLRLLGIVTYIDRFFRHTLASRVFLIPHSMALESWKC